MNTIAPLGEDPRDIRIKGVQHLWWLRKYVSLEAYNSALMLARAELDREDEQIEANKSAERKLLRRRVEALGGTLSE
jgi:hypothetical protein